MDKVMIADGYYPTVESLVNQVKRMAEGEAWKAGILFFDTDNVFKFDTWPNDELGPYVTTSLPELWFAKNYHSTLPKSNIDSLFVYCDVLEHVPVGDTLAPLLRAVVVRGRPGDQISEKYINPMYLPLQKKSFESIEINIMTDTGDPVPFVDGPSTVTLHFRRASK